MESLSWGNERVTFRYNDAGIRISKNDIQYYLDGPKILAEGRENQITTKYYYDSNGITAFEYNGKLYYYIKNLLGDIIQIVDQYGNLQASYYYDAWGAVTVKDANGNDITDQDIYKTHIGNINPFRYRGYYYDVETGLYYLNTRYYDPIVKRFINADSFKYLEPDTLNGLNLYAYCRNNPVNMIDPAGNKPFPWWAKLLIGVALIVLAGIGAAFLSGVWGVLAGAAFYGALTGALGGALISGIIGLITDGWQGMLNGMVNGFMWGSVSGFVTGILTTGLNIATGE